MCLYCSSLVLISLFFCAFAGQGKGGCEGGKETLLSQRERKSENGPRAEVQALEGTGRTGEVHEEKEKACCHEGTTCQQEKERGPKATKLVCGRLLQGISCGSVGMMAVDATIPFNACPTHNKPNPIFGKSSLPYFVIWPHSTMMSRSECWCCMCAGSCCRSYILLEIVHWGDLNSHNH